MKDSKVSLRLPQELLDQIKSTGEEHSEFIRRAIANELTNAHNAGKEFNSMKRKINNLDVDSLHQALGDLIVTAQTIFTEQLTQRELLKLAHRRATFAASFSMYALDELRKETKTSSSELKDLINMVEDEHKELNIFREDKSNS